MRLAKIDFEPLTLRAERHDIILKPVVYFVRVLSGKKNFSAFHMRTHQYQWKEMDVAAVDAFIEFLEESPMKPPWMKELRDSNSFQGLLFLRVGLSYPDQQPVDDDFTLKQFAELGSKLGCIISGFDLKKMDEETARKLFKQLQVPLKPLEWWVMHPFQLTESKEPKPLRDYYSTTAQLGFVDHLVENLEQLVNSGKFGSTGPLKGYLVRLQRMLHLLSSCLMEIKKPHKEDPYIQHLTQRITDLAYEVEYIIDSFLVKRITAWCCICWLQDAQRGLEEYEWLVKLESGNTNSIVTSIINAPSQNRINIIPLVNSASIANNNIREILNDPAIIDTFSVRTWSLASSYKERKRDVFLDLLRNSSKPFKNQLKAICEQSEDMVQVRLFSFMHFDKVLIILENVSDIDAINDIRRRLHRCCRKGNTILVTTSSRELALECRRASQGMFLALTSSLQTNKLTTNDNDVVGFKAETEEMLEFLTGGETQLRLISITGMAGQGKTTLAKKLYNDVSIINFFDTRTWCCVSQSYDKKQLLLELLGHVVQLSDIIREKNDEELAGLLYRQLKGSRFLIFLDDIWEINAWNDLARCFPDDNNGSRIIITTRLQDLASQAKSHSKLQSLPRLSNDESWELLKKKLFQDGSCPSQLLAIGRKIAKICKGLPLAVILVAGLLTKMEKRVDQWEQIVDSLSSRILGDAEAESKSIIELSYKNLPDDLKACFLYFGVFLDDKEVPVQKLIQIWIAEGFIRHTDGYSLEDTAESYLMDLISRCLVTVAQEKSKGGAKSCHVHDLLREFCLIKAGEENFLQEIHGYDEHFPSSNHISYYGLDPNYSSSSTPIVYHLRRLCILSKMNHFIKLKPYGSSVRSLLFFAANDLCPSDSYDMSFISRNFELLRILDLGNINIGDSLKWISMLIHLRYLAVEGDFDFIPSSMANLWNLQTFLVKGLVAKVIKVPDSIWDMAKLRHIHINGAASFDLDPQRLANSSVLDTLQTFSTPSLAYGDDMEKMMSRLKSIRKLKCIFLDHWDDAANYFPRLEFLSQLESLNVFYNGKGKFPCKFSFPSNLKKLTLSNFHMPWSEISQLTIACNLEVLKLVNNAFKGERWEMKDEVFTKLKFLKLDTLDVIEWSAEGDQFPLLERLLLHKCERLDTIPASLGGLPTLQMIEVKWCSHSVANSAKEIQKEQLEYGNKLKVHVCSEV